MPAAVPPGSKPLQGPQSCGSSCDVARVHDVSSAGIRRVGVITRGLDSTLAVETESGWFFEPATERFPRMSSHHQPQSRGYDLTATRVEDGAVIVRLVDSRSVFYPGQGRAGSSHVSWSERRCVVVNAVVHCSGLAHIASQSCTTERTREPGGFQRSCKGGPPPT